MKNQKYIKEGQHLKTLLKLNKLTKEESIFPRKDLKHLLDGYIFYPISTWPSSIKEILEHDTIIDKNTFKLILFANGNGISPNVFIKCFYSFIVNKPSKIRKPTHQIHWIVINITRINVDGTTSICITDPSYSSAVLQKLKLCNTHQT